MSQALEIHEEKAALTAQTKTFDKSGDIQTSHTGKNDKKTYFNYKLYLDGEDLISPLEIKGLIKFPHMVSNDSLRTFRNQIHQYIPELKDLDKQELQSLIDERNMD
jgi:hypothetical protein